MAEARVIIEDGIGASGKPIRKALIIKDLKIRGAVAVAPGSSPEQISNAFLAQARTTESKESKKLLTNAASLVLGLEKK